MMRAARSTTLLSAILTEPRKIEARIVCWKADPLQLGIMASTDSHSARPGYVAERGWRGHIGNFDLPDERRESAYTLYNPGGLIGVWAEENTREAVFRAMQRRETFGTSGPRIRVKLEQTFDQEVDLCAASEASDAPRTLMGGTFEAETRSPVFFVGSMKDRAELDHVQIIKLELVAGSVEQSMVSLAPQPCARWVDTRYDPSVPALYYVRVLEAPTQRWQGDDKIRERAWTSPIWAVPVPTRTPRPDRWQRRKATDLISVTH